MRHYDTRHTHRMQHMIYLATRFDVA